MTIKKLSKYGIVLVAAVTLTTAVQAQFGQSSTKVYAEETASDANYEDYRMFYAYFAEYPDDPNSGAMSGRVTTVSKPYIVGEEPFGPGSYDIFDITGKHYNVGDVITINEPFLNHKDEEDNRLYYYYHPQNSDNTSEAPAVSTTPATSEAPAVSTTPATSEAPAVSTTPATSENPISDNDPSLNRMLYLNYSVADDPKRSWLTGDVVTPKGYTVMPADELEGYPYYTITGSNGKNYSVGDVITTEEPGLFGHANYEDDALYYRYYRTNPNSVSETPAVSTTPATSEAPAVSTTPATSETPAVSTTPATSEAPAVSTTPATSETPAVSTTPTTSEAPAVSTTPATSETPAVSTTPATSETPAASTTPTTSEAPAVSTTPATSETPAVSTTPATSETPAVSTTPATSETPAASTTPTTSEAPAASTTPATSEAPAVSTTPATSEAPAVSTTPATSETPAASTTPATSETPAVSTTPATSLVPSKDIHSMNSVTYSSTQTRNAGIKSEADGKLTSHDLPKTGDTNSKVGMLGMIFVGLGLTSFVYKGRHRRS